MTAGDGELPEVSEPALAADPWRALRRATPARVGLGRSGDTMPLAPVLAFQLAHAKARDAVHAAFDLDALTAALAPQRVLRVRSEAPDRPAYLKRPDLGRRLEADSRGLLSPARGDWDCVFVVADGLSAQAGMAHAAPLLAACLPLLDGLHVAPVIVATQARVALGDDVGETLGAKLCVVLIGERPGLSVADSLGAYVTFAPRPGRRDSERNCLSNIHDHGGFSTVLAARKLAWLIRAGLQLGATGVVLKEAEEAVGLRDARSIPGDRTT